MNSAGVVKFDLEKAAVMSRRAFVLGASALALAACQTTSGDDGDPTLRAAQEMYGAVDDPPFQIAPVDLTQIPPQFWRTIVTTLPAHIPNRPGEIVVDPANRYLYRIGTDGLITRYGVGVGREGFAWSGRATIQRKESWPTWTPTAAMVERDPSARPWANGMPGGPPNPLGARAMYLYRNGADTLYRLHGTNAPASIGQALSSGCIRLLNQDVIHLFNQTPMGTAVTVLSA